MNKRILFSFVCCLLAGFFLPVTVFATTIFGPQEFAVSWFGVHLSSHSFSADPAVEGNLKISKDTGKRYKTGFLMINGKKVDLHSFLRGSEAEYNQQIKLKKKIRCESSLSPNGDLPSR